MYSKTLEKDDRVTPQVVLFLQSTLNETHSSNVPFAKSAMTLSAVQSFIVSLNMPDEFAFPMSLGINSHILEVMLYVPKYTERFLRLCIFGSFLKLCGFCGKGEISFIISGPKSYFSSQILVARIFRFFGKCSLICSSLTSKQNREIIHLYRQVLNYS